MNKPVNGAGAVDLAALKNAPSDQQRAQAIHEALQNLSLVCDCGVLIERGGQEVVIVAIGIMDTPRGPAQGMNVSRRAFCSAGCEHFGAFERAAIASDTLLVVSRPLPANRWAKRPRALRDDQAGGSTSEDGAPAR